MNSANATKRSPDDGASGSHAMNGVAAIRPTVTAFGRFTRLLARSRERLEHELAHAAQRLEDAVAVDGNRLEVLRALDPLAGGQLLDEKLARVIRIGRDALLRRLGDLPSRVERRLQLGQW